MSRALRLYVVRDEAVPCPREVLLTSTGFSDTSMAYCDFKYTRSILTAFRPAMTTFEHSGLRKANSHLVCLDETTVATGQLWKKTFKINDPLLQNNLHILKSNSSI